MRLSLPYRTLRSVAGRSSGSPGAAAGGSGAARVVGAALAVLVALAILAIEPPKLRPLLLGLVAILCALAWPFVARPRGPLLIFVPAVATAICGALATKLWLTADQITDRGQHHDYALTVEGDGQHVLPVRTVPGVPGMQVRLLASNTSAAPLSWSQIEACDWRVRWRGREMTSDGTCFHLPNYDGGICLADTWLVDDVAPDGEQFEVAYVVNERTRSIVERLKVRVKYPFTYGNDLAMGWAFSGLARLFLAGLVVVGVVAIVVGSVRTCAARRAGAT